VVGVIEESREKARVVTQYQSMKSTSKQP